MAPQPHPAPSTRGTAARAPPPASVEGPAYRSTNQRCVVLVDWWLVRDEDDKICVAGYPEKNRATRLFYSDSITVRHADGTLETADHKILLIRGQLNMTQMRCNGFPYEVSKYFRLGFPAQWEKYANSNMNQMNENTQSPSKPTKYYIEKFLHGSFINSAEYNFTEVDSKLSKGPTGNTDGPPSRELSEGLCNGRMGMPDESCEDHVPAETCGNTDTFPVRGLQSLANGTPRLQEPSGNSGDYHNSVSNTATSEGLCNGRMGMPDESLEDPGTSGNSGDNHNSMSNTTASEGCNGRMGMPDGSFEDPVPGETCSGQTCQAAKPHELEALAKGLSPAFGIIQCSKDNTGRTLWTGKDSTGRTLRSGNDNTGRTLRSGKVCGMSNGASFKKGHSKRKAVQHETLNMKVIPTEETTSPSDPTCQQNGGSGAQIPAADIKPFPPFYSLLPSKDSDRRGRGRPRKKARHGENI